MRKTSTLTVLMVLVCIAVGYPLSQPVTHPTQYSRVIKDLNEWISGTMFDQVLTITKIEYRKPEEGNRKKAEEKIARSGKKNPPETANAGDRIPAEGGRKKIAVDPEEEVVVTGESPVDFRGITEIWDVPDADRLSPIFNLMSFGMKLDEKHVIQVCGKQGFEDQYKRLNKKYTRQYLCPLEVKLILKASLHLRVHPGKIVLEFVKEKGDTQLKHVRYFFLDEEGETVDCYPIPAMDNTWNMNGVETVIRYSERFKIHLDELFKRKKPGEPPSDFFPMMDKIQECVIRHLTEFYAGKIKFTEIEEEVYLIKFIVRGLKGKITGQKGMHERLEVLLVLFPLKDRMKILCELDGKYATGWAAPRSDQEYEYDLEPKYSMNLHIYGKQLLLRLKDIIKRELENG